MAMLLGIWMMFPAAAVLAYDQVYYYHNDHLGTPQVMTDQTGAVVWKAEYEPFGKATVTTATITNKLRFPGQYFDAETGLHYNYQRDYDPQTGRYLTPDPIGLEGGLNLYRYTGNNPVNFIDPSGLRCTYSQSTGKMTCVDDNGRQYYNETGYSGTGPGRNNPDMQDAPNTGPVPRGSWEWGTPRNSPNTGRNTVPLDPQPGNECFDTPRDCNTFRAHGNNARNDASHGCIVLPQNRTQIPPGEIVDVIR